MQYIYIYETSLSKISHVSSNYANAFLRLMNKIRLMIVKSIIRKDFRLKIFLTIYIYFQIYSILL